MTLLTVSISRVSRRFRRGYKVWYQCGRSMSVVLILLIECGAVEDEYNTILILFDYPSYGTR